VDGVSFLALSLKVEDAGYFGEFLGFRLIDLVLLVDGFKLSL
jgi:hypothetical protein